MGLLGYGTSLVEVYRPRSGCQSHSSPFRVGAFGVRRAPGGFPAGGGCWMGWLCDGPLKGPAFVWFWLVVRFAAAAAALRLTHPEISKMQFTGEHAFCESELRISELNFGWGYERGGFWKFVSLPLTLRSPHQP